MPGPAARAGADTTRRRAVPAAAQPTARADPWQIPPAMALRILADLVLLLHLAVVVFVVGGLAAVVLGHRQGWAWVRNLPFRLAHLAAIGVVAAQAWLGQVCPLTTLESWLRVQAGGLGYQRGFIEHWVHAVLFHEAPPWVFTLAYTLFALLVALAWWRCPPRRRAEVSAARSGRKAARPRP